jgi:RNA polymerase sigma-70 factor (ECF subfamily)
MNVTDERTDAELLGLMASGDADAFAAIFGRHRGTVYRFSRQMLGSRDAAEDVTQDVFLALARSAGRFDGKVGALSTYLYGIARHLILQRYKRSRRWTEVDIEHPDVERIDALATSADPADDLSRAQMRERLRHAILTLPVRYREVVVLCELNGLSYEDAAAIAACPVGTVRSRLNRARGMLVERCRHMLGTSTVNAKSGVVKRWLVPTKNNC